jgi:signal transduction histidine kinase
MKSEDASEIARDVAELYEPVAEEAGIQLKVEAETALPVLASRELIGQALANLIDNAIKYSPNAMLGQPEPSVTVSVRALDGRVELAVADHGTGIPASDRDRVFERFVRLETSRTRPGSGLGLSLASAVARLHGGTIRLEDNVPGLRAVLSLPVANA